MFRIRQRVVCVDDTEQEDNLIKEGEIYTVSDTGIVNGSDVVYLFELPRMYKGRHVRYIVERFRPLDEDYAEGVLSKIKEGIDENLELLEQIKTKENV